MNLKKIAFIICVNNELYFEECCWYINRLHIPDSFEIDIISVREAHSMTEAYNAAMESSDAKYKVYLHQDVFIYNQNFISDILKVFQADEAIGMLGLIGGRKLPENGVIYKGWDCGKIITSNWTSTGRLVSFQEEPYVFVDAVDGLLLATQYDIRWREDILKDWDFYDVAQAFEFKKAGYHIVVPYQKAAWVNHDCGYSKLGNYNKNRKIMFGAYPEFFTGIWEEDAFKYPYELEKYTKQFYKEVEERIDKGRYEEAEILLNGFEDSGKDKNLLLLKHILDISKAEKEAMIEPQIFTSGLTTNELLERYTRIKFYLRRVEIGEEVKEKEIYDWIHLNGISYIEILINTTHSIIDKKYVLRQVSKAYRAGYEEEKAAVIEEYIYKNSQKENYMKKKKVGVVISCYNHVDYVEQAIDSILAQTYQDFDVYAADDASTDGTREKLIQYDEQLKEIHLFDENVGDQVAFLAERVDNEYIALLNSDDFWHKDKLDKQVRYMEENPDCAACFTWVRQVNDKGEGIGGAVIFQQDNRTSEEWMRFFYEDGNCLAHPSILIRAEIYKELIGSWYVAFRQLPDFQMWVRLVQKHKIHIIEEELLNFRWHSSENTTNVSIPAPENFARVLNEECYMWWEVISDMEEEYFRNTFDYRLLNKQPQTAEEVKCEKFFVLAKAEREALRQAAVFYFYDIYKDKKVQNCFEEIYGFRRKDFYKLETEIGFAKNYLDWEAQRRVMREIGQCIVKANR